MQTSIHVIENPEKLSANLPAWSSLASQIDQLPPFCAPKTWVPGLQVLLKSADESNSPFQAVIVEVFEGDELQAVFPLYRTRGRLANLSSNHLDYQEIVALSPEAAEEALAAAIRFACEANLLFVLGHVSEQSRLAVALGSKPSLHGAWVVKRYFGICIVSDSEFPSHEPECFIKSLSRRHRRSFRSGSKRMAAHYPDMEVKFLEGAEIKAKDIEAIAALHCQNQQHRAGRSPFESEEYVSFVIEQAKVQDEMILSILRCGDELVAFVLGYFSQNTYYFYLTDYDRRFAGVSPGIWLMVQTCSRLIDNQKAEMFRIDFLLGSELYKTHWETGRYNAQRVIIIPKSAKMLPLMIFYRCLYALKEFKNRLFKLGSWAAE